MCYPKISEIMKVWRIIMLKQKKYLYTINYPVYEEELCKMEMKYVFSIEANEKHFLSDLYVNPSRSTFIKEVIKILYVEDTLEEILDNIKRDMLNYEKFKILFIKLQDCDVSYEERLRSIREIGLIIKGIAIMKDAENHLALTRLHGKWIFGEYQRNDYEWHIHDRKPYTYSNSLSVRVAKSLVNIAIGNDLDKTLIDPCCGIGTVVIEALSMDVNVIGYDINKSIASKARDNAQFFGYERDYIKQGDMHEITKRYDSAIIDIPYGLFTPITLEEQINIIKTAYKICDMLVLVAFEDMSNILLKEGFKIIDRCNVCKGKFKRYIFIANGKCWGA